MDKKIAIIAAIVIIVVAIAAISLSQQGGNNGDDDQDDGEIYEFTDSNGYEHSVHVPISNVSVVHKYIPMFMKVLGVEDEVAGLDSTYGMSFERFFDNCFSIGSFSEPNGEIMLQHGSNIILSPITMGLSNGDSLNEMGIEVIYLDLTDPQAIEQNLEILVNLFGATEEVVENYNKYMDLFYECYDYVDQFDFSATADADVCLYMSSSGFYQTHESAAVKVLESVSGQSYTHIVDPNVKDTVYFNQSPTVIYNFDGEYGLDYLFLYSMDTHQENLQKFLDSGKDIDLSTMSCFENKHVYSISTDCVNGVLSCVSLILYADAFGADVGDKATEIVQAFNDTFGLDYQTGDLIEQMA